MSPIRRPGQRAGERRRGGRNEAPAVGNGRTVKLFDYGRARVWPLRCERLRDGRKRETKAEHDEIFWINTEMMVVNGLYCSIMHMFYYNTHTHIYCIYSILAMAWKINIYYQVQAKLQWHIRPSLNSLVMKLFLPHARCGYFCSFNAFRSA